MFHRLSFINLLQLYPVFAESDVYVYWNLTVFDFPYLNAELSVDNGMTYTLIAENIDAHSGGYTYLYLSDTPADSCILKLYNASDPTEYGLSEVFTISPLPVYNLTSPAAGELVNTNSPYTIEWIVENPYSAYCYLEYSVNNGQTWEFITDAMYEGNSGSYEWYTPNVNSEECLVRIADSARTALSSGILCKPLHLSNERHMLMPVQYGIDAIPLS